MKDHQIYGFQTDHEISQVLHMVYQSILLLIEFLNLDHMNYLKEYLQ